MTWFKVDDKFHSHRKVVALGKDVDALALWVVAGSWSADQLTDGFVPDSVLFKLLPVSKARVQRMALALESARLWDRVAFNPESICAQSDANLDPNCAQIDSNPNHVSESGWQFHGWSERGRQPKAEHILADREANAARQAEFRERRKRERNAVSNGVTNSVSNRTPTRPDPTLIQQQRAGASERPAAAPAGATPLIDTLAAEGFVVSWDLGLVEWDRVRLAVERSGIPAMVEYARRRHAAAKSPAYSARAWIQGWGSLPTLDSGARLQPAPPSAIGAPSEAAAVQPRPYRDLVAEGSAPPPKQPAFDFGDFNGLPT